MKRFISECLNVVACFIRGLVYGVVICAISIVVLSTIILFLLYPVNLIILFVFVAVSLYVMVDILLHWAFTRRKNIYLKDEKEFRKTVKDKDSNCNSSCAGCKCK